MNSKFLYIGHRGTRTDLDENTIHAFKKAIEFGSTHIEFDVRKTKDGEFVILHDTSLDRTTSGSGLLKDYKLEDIRKVSTRNNNCSIPLLTEVLLELRGKIQFIIELKDDGLRKNVPRIVQNYSLLENCVFSGRLLRDLRSIKKQYPQISTCYNITKGKDFSIRDLMNSAKNNRNIFKPDLISLKSTLISSEFIEICQDNDILSLAWDFLQFKDPISKIKSLIKLGIDGILFDDHKNIPIIKSWINSSLTI